MDDCKNEENSVCWKGSTVEDHEENSVCWKGSTVEDLESAFNNLFILESEIESWKPACCELVSRERKLVETKSSYKANKVATKSLSLDEVTTSVASNSLNVLGIDHSQFGSEFRVAEQEHPRASQLLCRRRKVKALEDLETEALIRKWGLDEEVTGAFFWTNGLYY
ncbi:hypothetical protein POTOM_060077 [Populus tomentosa]|uniref:Uncharacterized protein n=1 Tax=Populus tomentosa TaxID=118781 RepID=A0A8X7XR27_POPTO|nr:hypothetical protein POTOM_060077 [Populus tomentosa]